MRQQKHIDLITTTSSVDGIKVESYLGVVSHQIVIGANLFRDVFSSFRDVFGGAAKGYQKELEKWKNVGISELEKKAYEKDANGIIGLNMDFESVSGGNKSMFMISLSGTAVKLNVSETSSKRVENEKIDYDKLEFFVEKKKLELELKNAQSKNISESDIINYRVFNLEVDELVFNCIVERNFYLEGDMFDEIVKYFQEKPHRVIDDFFNSEKFNKEFKINYLVRHASNTSLLDFLKAINWFNYSVLENLLSSNNHKKHAIALHLLKLKKSHYEKADSQRLLSIAKIIDETYSIYPVLKTKQKTLGKDKKGWKCIRCESFQDESITKCSNCGANVYGIKVNRITPDEISEEYRLMAESIQEAVS